MGQFSLIGSAVFHIIDSDGYCFFGTIPLLELVVHIYSDNDNPVVI